MVAAAAVDAADAATGTDTRFAGPAIISARGRYVATLLHGLSQEAALVLSILQAVGAVLALG